MMRRGGWRPGAWEHKDQAIVLGVLYAAAWVRAIDYLTGEDPAANAIAEALMPTCYWAYLIIASSVILGIGWWQRRHLMVFLGHLILGTLYMSLACGVIAQYGPALVDLAADAVGDFLWTYGFLSFRPDYSPWKLDGIRNAGPLLTVALIHWITALRTGTSPIPRGHEEPEEIIACPGGGPHG